MSKQYYIINSIGILAMMMFNTLSGIIRALGNSLVSIYILIFSCILNILGDLLFIIKKVFLIKKIKQFLI